MVHQIRTHWVFLQDIKFSSAPVELWGDDALVLLTQQKDANPMPKKCDNVMQNNTIPEYKTDEFGSKVPIEKDEQNEEVGKK